MNLPSPKEIHEAAQKASGRATLLAKIPKDDGIETYVDKTLLRDWEFYERVFAAGANFVIDCTLQPGLDDEQT